MKDETKCLHAGYSDCAEHDLCLRFHRRSGGGV